MPSREEAWNLLTAYVSAPSLRRHCLAVETALRAYAPKYDGDADLWGITGLLHDFDYEKYPEVNAEAQTGHPFEGVKILREKGYPEEMLQAILGHALYSGVERSTSLSKCLFACDELCGFLVSMALMRPDQLESVTPETVRKYLKKPKFSERVSREDIALGVKELGIGEDEHFLNVIQALRNSADALGLRRS
jgi:putative nucleotidyltransferase with HDIG domain